MEEYILRHRTS